MILGPFLFLVFFLYDAWFFIFIFLSENLNNFYKVFTNRNFETITFKGEKMLLYRRGGIAQPPERHGWRYT